MLTDWWYWNRQLALDGDMGESGSDGAATPVAGYPAPATPAAAVPNDAAASPVRVLVADADSSDRGSTNEGPVPDLQADGEDEASPANLSAPGSPQGATSAASASVRDCVSPERTRNLPPDDESDSCDDACGAHRFMPRCIFFPGMLHLMHNLSWDLTEAMTYWPTFDGRLKNAGNLLSEPDLNRRLVSECITGSSHEPNADK